MICPKCGMEFVDGITQCSDCKIPLVAPSELKKEMISLIELPKSYGQRLADFLIYSKLHAQIEETDAEDLCMILVPEDEKKQAQKLAAVFLQEEPLEELSSGDDPEESSPEDFEKQSQSMASLTKGSYTLASNRYEDAKGTFWMLFGAAIILTGICLRNTIAHFSQLIHLTYDSYLTYIVFWIISILLIWGAYKYYRIMKELKERIQTEDSWHQQIIAWLNSSFTADSIDQTIREHYGNVQEEIFVLNRYDYLKREAVTSFPDIDPGFLDLEIEAFYETTFES